MSLNLGPDAYNTTLGTFRALGLTSPTTRFAVVALLGGALMYATKPSAFFYDDQASGARVARPQLLLATYDTPHAAWVPWEAAVLVAAGLVAAV